MLGVVDDEHHSLNYVQIPQESFVNGQNQHEASFENSYSFEATEGNNCVANSQKFLISEYICVAISRNF